MDNFQPDPISDPNLADELLEAKLQYLRSRLSALFLNQDQPISPERNFSEICMIAEFVLLTPAIVGHMNAKAIQAVQDLLPQLSQQLQDAALELRQQTQTDLDQSAIQIQEMLGQTAHQIEDALARPQQNAQAYYEKLTDLTIATMTRVTHRLRQIQQSLRLLWIMVISLIVLFMIMGRQTISVFDKQAQLNTAIADNISAIVECLRQGKSTCEIKVSPSLPSRQTRRR